MSPVLLLIGRQCGGPSRLHTAGISSETRLGVQCEYPLLPKGHTVPWQPETLPSLALSILTNP